MRQLPKTGKTKKMASWPTGHSASNALFPPCFQRSLALPDFMPCLAPPILDRSPPARAASSPLDAAAQLAVFGERLVRARGSEQPRPDEWGPRLICKALSIGAAELRLPQGWGRFWPLEAAAKVVEQVVERESLDWWAELVWALGVEADWAESLPLPEAGEEEQAEWAEQLREAWSNASLIERWAQGGGSQRLRPMALDECREWIRAWRAAGGRLESAPGNATLVEQSVQRFSQGVNRGWALLEAGAKPTSENPDSSRLFFSWVAQDESLVELTKKAIESGADWPSDENDADKAIHLALAGQAAETLWLLADSRWPQASLSEKAEKMQKIEKKWSPNPAKPLAWLGERLAEREAAQMANEVARKSPSRAARRASARV